MDIETFKSIIENLVTWKKGGERSPYKPLLLLYTLGEIYKKQRRLIPYREASDELTKLLIEFGPIRKKYHPEDPFVRLTKSGIWELDKRVDEARPSNKELIEKEVRGGFTQDVFDMFSTNVRYIIDTAHFILMKHFPKNLSEEILKAVGIPSISSIKVDSSEFRNRILRAYSYRCAICNFNSMLENSFVGLEAAHIQWRQAGGPDTEDNGLALCSLHHQLFDKGVFTLSKDLRMILSQRAHGTYGFEENLLRYHGNKINEPIEKSFTANVTYILWHQKQVFKGPERSI